MRTTLLPAALLLLSASASSQQFGPETAVVPPMPVVSGLALADFDGDGDVDVVSLGAQASGVSSSPSVWSENLGSGRFAAQRALLDGDVTRKSDARAADADGDGDMDIFFTAVSPQGVGWIENLGSGTFGGPHVLDPGTFTNNQIEAVDLNGDGRTDLVVREQFFRLSWFEGLGGGSFSARQILTENVGTITSFDVADLDLDGDVDVVFSEFSGSEIRWIEQVSPGTFAPEAFVTDRINRPALLRVVDFDGDGLPDLVAEDSFRDEIQWSGGQGAGSFGPSQVLYAPNQGVITAYAVTDLNGDGQLDLAASSSGAPVVEIIRAGAGFLPPAELPTSFASRQIILPADLDGDGRSDLVTGGGGVIGHRRGPAGFEDAKPLHVVITQRDLHVTADLNSDGLADLAVVRAGGFDIHLGAGDGQWEASSQSFEALPVGDLEALDLDGDSDLDLVVAGGDFDAAFAYVAWAENQGDGTFADLSTLYTGLADGAGILAAGDLEGDGDLDLLTTHLEFLGAPNSFRVAWIEQTAPGVFQQPFYLANNELPTNVILTDIDADGAADALIGRSSTAGGSLVWRRGDGLGQFGPETVIRNATLLPVRETTAGDVDGDGRVDVVIAGPAGVELYLWDSTAGAFAAPVLLDGPFSSPAGLRLADLTGDGRHDLLAWYANGRARWFENLGSGSFSPSQALPLGASGSEILGVADFDGDQDVDVFKSRFGQDLAWNANLARFGFGYCGPAQPNSTGDWGTVSATGSQAVSDNDVTLMAERLPAASFGYFLVGPVSEFVPGAGGSQGTVCIGDPVGRLNRGSGEIFQTNAIGEASVSLDLTNIPTPTGAVSLLPGDTRFFQAWYRDANPGGTSNFTNGLRITFE